MEEQSRSDEKSSYKTIELLAKFGDNECYGVCGRLLRGIDVSDARVLIDFLKPHLPELYLTLHYASDCQAHPRLRGWSQKPQIQRRSSASNYGGWNHPDWSLNRKIALFEAYIGKSGEYWTSDLSNILPLAKRIEKDYESLFNELLKSHTPEITPDSSCLTDVLTRLKNKEYSKLFQPMGVDTLIYKIKG